MHFKWGLLGPVFAFSKALALFCPFSVSRAADMTGAQDGSVRMFEWNRPQQLICFRQAGNARVTRLYFNSQGNKVHAHARTHAHRLYLFSLFAVIVLTAVCHFPSAALLTGRASSVCGRSTKRHPTPNPTWWVAPATSSATSSTTATHQGSRPRLQIAFKKKTKLNLSPLSFNPVVSCWQSWQCHTKTCGDFAFITSSSLIATAGQSSDNRFAASSAATVCQNDSISFSFSPSLETCVCGILWSHQAIPWSTVRPNTVYYRLMHRFVYILD